MACFCFPSSALCRKTSPQATATPNRRDASEEEAKAGEKKADKAVETLMRVIPYRDAVVDVHIDEEARTVSG
jgi:hypothetical protein